MSDNNKRSDEIRLKEIKAMERRLIEDLFSTEESHKIKVIIKKTLNTPKN